MLQENRQQQQTQFASIDASIVDFEPHASRSRVIGLSCLAFLISYIITAGPAVFIVKRIDLPAVTAIAEVLYAPIILVVKSRIPILSGAIQLYLDLFQ